MASEWACWKCGADLGTLPVPFGRRAECQACHAALHVCRMCRHYDVGKAKQCREPMAEAILDKSRANFCEWFQARSRAFAPASPGQGEARKALNALFGGPTSGQEGSRTESDAKSDLDRLFGD